MAKMNGSQESNNTYGIDQIKILEGLEAVRNAQPCTSAVPGHGLHHLVFEVVYNSVDEALAGACDRIEVTIHIDNSVTVVDNGRGIPVEIHEQTGRSGVEVVLTTLHAGGKFGSSAYKVSGGLHGVGVSVVNALSEWLEVEVWTGGKKHLQRYERGADRDRGGGTRPTREPVSPSYPTEISKTERSADVEQRSARMAFLNRG
jgi:DNA gyrase subunit B